MFARDTSARHAEVVIDNLDTLANLIEQERDALLAQWREQVRELPSAKHLDTPSLNDHIPRLLDELAAALRGKSDETIPEALNEGSPPAHGLQRVRDGYDIEEVVSEYNILRGCIHDLALANHLNLQGKSFHILNRVLDGAIGLAVQTFATRQAVEVQRRREEYLAFVAHDLRTPLSAISLAASALELTPENESANEENQQMMKILRRNVQQLEGLVGKVIEENTNLVTETGMRLERRSFDLWPLAEALIHDLRPIAGTGSTKLLNQVPDDLVIYADAHLMRRVFQNLIANAIHYTPRGEVIIGAEAHREDGAVECWVSDNGAGIPPERVERVFEELETDPQNETGLGIGLAIVKTFVEAHGGKVTVESLEGSGTTFRLSLPGNSTSGNS